MEHAPRDHQKEARDLAEEDAQTQAAQAAQITTATENGERLKKDLDDILDEVDLVLVHNAEQFVRNYVQKGGE